MPIDSKHKLYDDRYDEWKKCRDVIEGDKRVKQKEKYIPKLSGQDDKEYFAYINRVNFLNATNRTVDALTGLVFKKDIQKDTPFTDEQLDSITNNKQSIYELAENVVDEVIQVGRCGLLVDATSANIETKTNGIGYITMYRTEDIINWRYKNNKLVLVVLRECELVDTSDEFVQELKTNYRVLDIKDGFYRQRLFRENQDKQAIFDGNEIFPTIKGQKMREIPFVCIGVKNLGLDPEKSPILDLAETNITHCKFDIDRGHALHFVGLPTPYVIGHQTTENESINMGSSTMITIPNPAASLGFLELKGDGVGALTDYILELVDRMAFLGAKLLKDDKNVGETAEAMELKQNSEKAILTSIAKNVSLGIKYALQYLADFQGLPYQNIKFDLNTDYGLDKLSADERKQLMSEWQGGAITYETYFKNMQKGGVISKDETEESYKSKLDIEKPTLSIMPNITQTN